MNRGSTEDPKPGDLPPSTTLDEARDASNGRFPGAFR